MAELKKASVFKIEILSVSEYSEKYGGNITPQAIAYAMENDKLDFVRIGKERFIVMTDKTKTYIPNAHPRRGRRNEKKENLDFTPPVSRAVLHT